MEKSAFLMSLWNLDGLYYKKVLEIRAKYEKDI